jgi:WD40 repeat protein
MIRRAKDSSYYGIYLIFISNMILAACVHEVEARPDQVPLWQGKKEIVLRKLLTIGGNDLGEPNLVIGGINDIAFDSEDNVYILDFVNYRVSKFSSDGHFLAHYGKGKGQGPGELQYPTGVCVDPKGNVYIADLRQRIIHVYDKSNSEINFIRTEKNIGPIFGMAVSGDMELYAGVDLAFSTWEGGLFQIFSLPAGKYIGSFADCTWFTSHRNVMSGNNCMVMDESRGLIIVSHANPYKIDLFSRKRELVRSFGRRADTFDTYVPDRNSNKIMAGTTINLACLPSGIIINVVRHLTKSPEGMSTSRQFDFFNLEGDYLLAALDKAFGIEGAYNLVFKSDSKGNLWISYNEPYPHLDKLSIQFRDK